MIYLADLFYIAIIFFLLTWLLEIIYSWIEVAEDRTNLKERFVKSLYFFILQGSLGLGVILVDYFFGLE